MKKEKAKKRRKKGVHGSQDRPEWELVFRETVFLIWWRKNSKLYEENYSLFPMQVRGRIILSRVNDLLNDAKVVKGMLTLEL